MLPYFALIFVSFAFSYIAKVRKKQKLLVGKGEDISRNNLCITVFFVFLWFLVSFRSLEIGKDTQNYYRYFNRIINQSFKEVFFDSTEALYWSLNWIVGRVTDNFYVFLAIVSAICITPIAQLYMQDKRHSYLKIIIFANMSVFVMMFSGIRQSLAMGIGLIAFNFVKKKKLIWFFLTVIVAMGFHESAFILFAMYPLYYFRLRKKHLYIIIPSIIIVYIFNVPLFNFLWRVMQLFTSRYDDPSYSYNGAVTMLVLFIVFTLFAYIIPDDKKVDDEFIGIRNYLLLATLFQCFAPIHMLAMRMNYYYILFVPEVVARTFNYVDKRWNQVAKIAYVMLSVFFTLYFVINIVRSLETGGTLHTVPYIPLWAS